MGHREREHWPDESVRTVAERNALVEANMALVTFVIRRWHASYAERHGDDLTQAGYLGLLRAAELYDGGRGRTFATYATWWIRQATRALIRRLPLVWVPSYLPADDAVAIHRRMKPGPILEGEGEPASREAEALEASEWLDRAREEFAGKVAALPPRERDAMEAYLGGATLQQIAERDGLTRERIRQILVQAAGRMGAAGAWRSACWRGAMRGEGA